jgi:hypothetical protein
MGRHYERYNREALESGRITQKWKHQMITMNSIPQPHSVPQLMVCRDEFELPTIDAQKCSKIPTKDISDSEGQPTLKTLDCPSPKCKGILVDIFCTFRVQCCDSKHQGSIKMKEDD